MKNILGKRIQILRKENNLTQEDFAKIFGLGGKSTISQYESGVSRPDDDLKIKIAMHFNVSIDWLLGLTMKRNDFTPGSHNSFVLRCIEEGIFEEGVEPDTELVESLIEIMKVTSKHIKNRRE